MSNNFTIGKSDKEPQPHFDISFDENGMILTKEHPLFKKKFEKKEPEPDPQAKFDVIVPDVSGENKFIIPKPEDNI